MEEEIVNLINRILEKYHIDIHLNVEDIYLDPNQADLIFFATERVREGDRIRLISQDKFKDFLDRRARTRYFDYAVMYHMLKYEYALQALENKVIQLSSLAYIWENDPLEYSEFFRRAGMYHFLHNDEINRIKENVFIFCFCDSCRNEDSWKLYGNDETGLAIGFRFKSFSDNPVHKDLYLLKDIVYDMGYDFDFIIEMQEKLFCRFNRRLVFEGVTKFGKYYKRGKYEYEREIRLCFDYQENLDLKDVYRQFNTAIPAEKDLETYFEIENDEEHHRRFIRIPFNNPLFEIEVSEVICGKNVNNEQFQRLQTLVQETPIRLWKRK